MATIPTVVFQDVVFSDYALAVVDYEGARSIGLYKEGSAVLSMTPELLEKFIDRLTIFQKVAAQVAMSPEVEAPPEPEPVEVHQPPQEDEALNLTLNEPFEF